MTGRVPHRPHTRTSRLRSTVDFGVKFRAHAMQHRSRRE